MRGVHATNIFLHFPAVIGIRISGASGYELFVRAVAGQLSIFEKKNSRHQAQQVDAMGHEDGGARAFAGPLENGIVDQ